MGSAEHIAQTDKYSARNYNPLPIVISKGEGCWVWDPEGKKYLDCLASYSALNQGHRHPRIIQALKDQADRVTLTSRAFHNDQLGPFLELLCKTAGYEKALPMNSGAEAVETALKIARKWGYKVKGVPDGQAEIVCCADNFHGRTITIVSCSTEPQYREGFGPFTPGFKVIPYGDAKALRAAITKNTVAFLVEPVQGEAGILIPPTGYLKECRQVCTENNVLFVADEIQTGFGRTGRMFACEHEGVRADMVIVGKALGGGVIPISAAIADQKVMQVLNPGDHGSTFGGNPLACAVAIASLRVLLDENLAQRSAELGKYFMDGLTKIQSRHVKEIRGKGLFIGVEIKKESGTARPYCESLMKEGVLAKETHSQVIRFAPPLVIQQSEIDWALDRVRKVLTA